MSGVSSRSLMRVTGVDGPIAFLGGLPRGKWVDDALCAEIGGDSWFPDKGENPAAAKKACRRCPVRIECLDYAMSTGERHGIWGGLSETERRRARRAP